MDLDREGCPGQPLRHALRKEDPAHLAGRCRVDLLDGSKPVIESAAIANAIALQAVFQGFAFPPGSADGIPAQMRQRSEGGVLETTGQDEVVSCVTADGAQIKNDFLLRTGRIRGKRSVRRAPRRAGVGH
ncbi:hypothetical protein [Bradyrhizobium glycinis]|uniref:hypothetical protein n=1 Tax=Bradyrhizobium glycinis TaxID=2751812 RepID=UPI0035E204B4